MLRRKRASGSSSGILTKAALDYGRLGWSVIPIEPRGKRPLIRWEVYQYRRADPTEVGAWFTRWPEANIAVVTGVISGVVVVDLDPRHGGDASIERLQREHSGITETVEAATGGGGRHLYFRHPGEIMRNRVGVAAGVDLRGDGGYVVAPPSVHACGQRYRWIRPPELCLLADLPPWLAGAPADDEAHKGHPLTYWRTLLREGVAEGERNNRIASLAGHLLWHGVDPEVATELLLTWNATRCRPPLDSDEVVRTVESIARLHERGGGSGD